MNMKHIYTYIYIYDTYSQYDTTVSGYYKRGVSKPTFNTSRNVYRLAYMCCRPLLQTKHICASGQLRKMINRRFATAIFHTKNCQTKNL